MERKAIGISGISTSSSYEDGECLTLLDMRHEQGVLKPVEPLAVERELQQKYDYLFIHKNNDYENLLAVRDGNIYWVKDNGSEVFIVKSGNNLQIESIGNLLIIDSETIYLFYNDNYELIILPEFSIGYETTDTALRVSTTAFSAGAEEKWQKYFEKLNENYYKAQIKASEYGYFIDSVFVIATVEFFDGSEVIVKSPVFIPPPGIKDDRFESLSLNNTVYDFANYPKSLNILIDSIYMTDLVSANNGCFEAESGKVYRDMCIGISSENNITSNYFRTYFRLNRLYLDLKKKDINNYIKSINFYATNQFVTINRNHETFQYMVRESVRGNSSYFWNLRFSKNDKNNYGRYLEMFDVYNSKKTLYLTDENIKQSYFYLIGKIDLDKEKEGKRNLNNIIKGKISDEVLRTQKHLSFDFLSVMNEEKKKVYNNKLHIYDFKEEKKCGNDVKYMLGHFHGTSNFYPNNLPLFQINWWIAFYEEDESIYVKKGVIDNRDGEFYSFANDINNFSKKVLKKYEICLWFSNLNNNGFFYAKKTFSDTPNINEFRH